jgi:hypothetical protein
MNEGWTLGGIEKKMWVEGALKGQMGHWSNGALLPW